MSDLRNFALIAHIDHGKTTLVDAMLHQSGIFRTNQEVPERVLDSNDQERERGITILAKNTAVSYDGIKLNILDTPGHADFGGEVERVLSLADGVVLLVDAAEGPLPQTRFVLKKALELRLATVVFINKIDRKDARVEEVLDEIYDLFIDLGVDEDLLDFPVVYGAARLGVAHIALGDDSTSLKPLFKTILANIPAPANRSTEPLRVLIANTEYDDYVGRVAIGKVVSGSITAKQQLFLLGRKGTQTPSRLMRLYTFDGLRRVEVDEASCGDIVAFAGIDEVEIGDTIAGAFDTEPLRRIEVDPPTLRMMFIVNNSPFAGTEGRYVTSRQIRERLLKAADQNVAIHIEDGPTPDQFEVSGRGELQLAVLVETLRREGYELQLSKPEVITKEIDGRLHEPVEELIVDVPDEYIGVVTEKLSPRKGKLSRIDRPGSGRARLIFRIPSRGLIGLRNELLTDTRGTAVMHSIVEGWTLHEGVLGRRPTGALVSDRLGTTTPYAIFHMQPRGILFVPNNTQVYEGMIVGEHNRDNDLNINICREKKLTNIRAAGKDEHVLLTPPRVYSLEEAIEFIDEDELIEVTPKSIRLRKKILPCNIRPKRTIRDEDAKLP